MDLLDELLGNASPYIANLVYDIDVRLLFIECMDSPEKQKPVLRIVFPDVLSYSEENAINEPDDDSIDDLVDIVLRHDGSYCIDTYKKSIVIKTGSEPFTETM